jgi:hypothetical protein
MRAWMRRPGTKTGRIVSIGREHGCEGHSGAMNRRPLGALGRLTIVVIAL